MICLAAWVSVGFASSLTITDKALSQADADSGTRYNTAWANYISPGNYNFNYYLGDGPMNMTVSGDITFSGYKYYYPGSTPAPKDEWSDAGSIVFNPMNGNVIQGYFGSTNYAERNTIKGDEARSYKLTFSGNASERNAVVAEYPRYCYAGGGAVYITNADISNFASLVFSGNSLTNKLPSVTASSNTYYSDAEGGALHIRKGVLSNINEIKFEGNSASSMARAWGGAVFMHETTIREVGSVTFARNKATSPEWSMGGAICSGITSSIESVDSVSFEENVSEINKYGGDAYGGALASNEGGRSFSFKLINHLKFTGNTVGQATALSAGTVSGGRLWGGAVYHSGKFYVQDSGEVEFSLNFADGTTHAKASVSVHGGAVTAGAAIFSGNAKVLFENNGALRHSESIRENLPDVAAYSYCGAFGGAVYSLQTHFYENTGDVVFRNNRATDRGGAVFIPVNSSGRGSKSYLYADGGGGDITFRGNTHKLAASNDRNSGVANAVWIEPAWDTVTVAPVLNVGATEGHYVNFYDPICSESKGNPTGGYYQKQDSYEKVNLVLGDKWSLDAENNLVEKYSGTIRFSGEYVRDTLAGSEGTADYEARVSESKKSILHATVQQYSGTLLLEHGVTFGVRGTGDLSDPANKTGTLFTQLKGVLDISGSVEHGETTFSGRALRFAGIGHWGQEADLVNDIPFIPADPDAIMSVLRPGDLAHFDADSIDMSTGMTVDFAHHMTETGFADVRAIRVTADQFKLGGTLGIQDNAIDSNYYYADNRWAKKHTFSLLLDENNAHEGSFDGIKSLAMGSNRIDSPYIYTGAWNQEWVDLDGDGLADQLNVVWTPDYIEPDPGPNPDPDPNPDPKPEPPAIRDILPELAGSLVMNSMWSSASNAKSVLNSALGALGTERFFQKQENNYWFKGLGDFTNHGSMGRIDGYDYNGGGYALGFDRKITDKTILGLAFGNLYGKTSGRSFVGDDKQTSNVGLLYGGWRSPIDEKNALSITGTAGYGWTRNNMDSFHTGGWSQGKWDNHTRFGTLQGQWDHSLENDWMLNMLLGLEYTDVMQKAFTETGWDARRFEKGSLKNMSLPVGVGVSKMVKINEMPWRNSVLISYVPDVYRENPHANATRLMNGYGWTAKGVSPDRNSVRAQVSSTLMITPSWTVYASYEFEGRSQSIYHRVNAGLSYSY